MQIFQDEIYSAHTRTILCLSNKFQEITVQNPRCDAGPEIIEARGTKKMKQDRSAGAFCSTDKSLFLSGIPKKLKSFSSFFSS